MSLIERLKLESELKSTVSTDRFTNFFYFYNLLKICNKAVVKYPIVPKTRHYTAL